VQVFRNRNDADVIVIGGGAAGLSAARALARAARVILLEARERLGGRVFSHPATRAMMPAELGAEFIHGQACETMRLLREIGSAAFDTVGEAWVARSASLEIEEGEFFEAGGIFEGARSLPQDESVERFLRRFEGDSAMRETVRAARTFVEGFEAADPATASAQAIAAEWSSGVDSTSARPLGGYAPTIEHLRSECARAGVDLRLSTIVARISWRSGRVCVDAVDASGASHTFEGRAAIVTLPVGVLHQRGEENDSLFEPALPSAKMEALNRIEMGRVVKVVLAFRRPFWETVADGRYRDAGFFRGESDAFGAYWTQYPIRGELIAAWAGGPRASALRELSKGELVDRALEGFGTLLGAVAQARSEFENGFVHDWDADPFARGAYSYVTVGGGNPRAVLAQPLGNALFFAGEATSTDGQGGTVNGALETGERAAAEAAAALGLN
jgi:monoamine oxidase